MSDAITPLAWLCSCVDVANARSKQPNWEIVAMGSDAVHLKNRETGEIWSFSARVVKRGD